MDPIEEAGKYFWILCVVVTYLNAGLFWLKSRKYIDEKPELESGYRTLIKGFAVWGNIPWLVMGLGITTGGVPSTWDYFRPKDGNPWVISWFASVFGIWALGTYWLIVRSGAEMLAEHPGMFNVDLKSPRTIKLIWLACLAGGVLGAIMMFTQEVPLPKNR